jgi:hypothetical protein
MLLVEKPLNYFVGEAAAPAARGTQWMVLNV